MKLKLNYVNQCIGFWFLNYRKLTITIALFIFCQAGLAENSVANTKLKELSNLQAEEIEKIFDAKPNGLVCDNSALNIKLNSAVSFDVLPVRYTPRPDTSVLLNAHRCGLFFLSSQGQQQELITIGIDNTEVLSCDGLDSLGIVRDASGGEHMGLMYKVSSPNIDSEGAMVVSWSKKRGRWFINTKISGNPTGLIEVKKFSHLRAIVGKKK